MITNASLTIYHKTLDERTKLEKWIRYNYKYVWWFGGKGAGLNKGYENANNVDVRVPYNNNNVDLKNVHIGDLLVKGDLKEDIIMQTDLKKYDVYSITSINDNNFGNNPHLHLGGK